VWLGDYVYSFSGVYCSFGCVGSLAQGLFGVLLFSSGVILWGYLVCCLYRDWNCWAHQYVLFAHVPFTFSYSRLVVVFVFVSIF